MNIKACRERLRTKADSTVVQNAFRFFKTGPGEYGEGDRFLGLRVPFLRQVVKEVSGDAVPADAEAFLHSTFHEERLFALLLWVRLFQRGDEACKKEIYERYLANTAYINNWDLVDSSAYFIVGPYLENRDRAVLYQLAGSENLWERRISIIATLHYIRKCEFDDALKLSERLRHDPEDLIHKATGWMLREVGNRDLTAERRFLDQHHLTMPRTMLRYAVEKFPNDQARRYLYPEQQNEHKT